MADAKKDKLHVGSDLGGHTYPYVRESDSGKVVSVGLLSPTAEALPRCDGMLELKHLEGNAFEVRSDVSLTAPAVSEHAGPARVNNAQYLQGWDRIFGQSKTIGQA